MDCKLCGEETHAIEGLCLDRDGIRQARYCAGCGTVFRVTQAGATKVHAVREDFGSLDKVKSAASRVMSEVAALERELDDECAVDEHPSVSLEEMTRKERSLLLFFETQAVDYGGRVDTRHMSHDDVAIAKRWNDDGFVEFGRVRSADHGASVTRSATHWVKLSDYAFELAALERMARAERMWERRQWRKTDEEG